MIILEMKNYNTILTENIKYQPYHQAKLINMNILVKKYYHLIKNMIEQANFTYSPLGKAFEKQIETIKDQGKKQIDELSSKRIGDIYNNSKEINFDDLICYFKDPCITPNIFIEFKGPMHIHNETINGDKTKNIEEDQK